MRVLALVGDAHHGKDTVASELTKLLGEKTPPHQGGHPVVVIGLADPLKRWMSTLFGLTREQCFGAAKDAPFEAPLLGGKAVILTPRLLFQRYGEDVRAQYPEAWVRQWMDTYRSAHVQGTRYEPWRGFRTTAPGRPPELAVCPDLRHPEDLAFLRAQVPARDLRVWRVVRPLPNGEPWRADSSETSHQGIKEDVLLNNDGDLSKLQALVRCAWEAW